MYYETNEHFDPNMVNVTNFTFFGQQHLHNHQHQRQNPNWHFHPALSGYHIITSQSHITQQPESVRGCDWLKAVFLFATETEVGTL